MRPRGREVRAEPVEHALSPSGLSLWAACVHSTNHGCPEKNTDFNVELSDTSSVVYGEENASNMLTINCEDA